MKIIIFLLLCVPMFFLGRWSSADVGREYDAIIVTLELGQISSDGQKLSVTVSPAKHHPLDNSYTRIADRKTEYSISGLPAFITLEPWEI